VTDPNIIPSQIPFQTVITDLFVDFENTGHLATTISRVFLDLRIYPKWSWNKIPTTARFFPSGLSDGDLFGMIFFPQSFIVQQTPEHIITHDFPKIRIEAKDKVNNVRFSFIIPVWLIVPRQDAIGQQPYFPIQHFNTLEFEGRIVAEIVGGDTFVSESFFKVGWYPFPTKQIVVSLDPLFNGTYEW
jgi:hypothetical protein